MSDKLLHVQVAEALGCKPKPCDIHEHAVLGMLICGCVADTDSCECHDGGDTHLARYDTDWWATGPLIERYDLSVEPTYSGMAGGLPWTAAAGVRNDRDGIAYARGETPLIAICNLILALKAAGKLHEEAA